MSFKLAGRQVSFHRAGNAGEGIAPHAADPSAKIVDVHLYTFNAVEQTEKWRQGFLAKVGAAPAAA